MSADGIHGDSLALRESFGARLIASRLRPFRLSERKAWHSMHNSAQSQKHSQTTQRNRRRKNRVISRSVHLNCLLFGLSEQTPAER